MNYSFIKDLIGSPWQIEATTLNSFYPVFRGLFNGLQIEKGTEPENQKPFKLSATTRDIRMWSSPEEPLSEEDNQPEAEPSREKVINVIPIRGIILKHDQECGPRGTRTLGNRLLKADEDESVIGHIMIIESGGGQANAPVELTDAMQKCTKPIVVWIDGMACSAAEYIAVYAKEIIASRAMDLVGCIGTMMVWEGRSSKSDANEDGEISVTIYADGSEEKNEEYETAINSFNFKLAKERILNPFNEKFKADVMANRPQVLPEQLKGRTYFACDVVGTLIDSIGDFGTAIDRVLALANFKATTSTEDGAQETNKPQKEMKQFAHLNQVLNVSELIASDEGVFLNEEQLASVEESLEANQQLVVEAQNATTERDTATASLATAQATIAAAYNPFNAIDPTIANAETPEAKAEAVRSLLAARPGTTPLLNLGGQDEIVTDPEADWETINNLPHNKLVDENL